MERLLIKRETLTKIADEVRALTGSTAQLSTDEMVELIEKSKQEMVTVTIDGVGVSTTLLWRRKKIIRGTICWRTNFFPSTYSVYCVQYLSNL